MSAIENTDKYVTKNYKNMDQLILKQLKEKNDNYNSS